MKDTTIAVDLAKNVFEIAISGEAGKVSKQLRVSRPKLVSFFAKQSAATVLLEACGSAHFWARTFRRLGHDVVLLPVLCQNSAQPASTKELRFSKSNSNSARERVTRRSPTFDCRSTHQWRRRVDRREAAIGT